ncbi:MAG: cell division protein ZapA [Nitrospinae bacterium]|nr:cell division protein ZapA [Nitrospinota bacterium]
MNETVDIKILNTPFTLKTRKGAHYIKTLESYVNNKIDLVRGNRVSLNSTENMETVLKACLAIADDYISLKEEVDNYEKDLGGIAKLIG